MANTTAISPTDDGQPTRRPSPALREFPIIRVLGYYLALVLVAAALARFIPGVRQAVDAPLGAVALTKGEAISNPDAAAPAAP